jgi:hypothetical protein
VQVMRAPIAAVATILMTADLALSSTEDVAPKEARHVSAKEAHHPNEAPWESKLEPTPTADSFSLSLSLPPSLKAPVDPAPSADSLPLPFPPPLSLSFPELLEPAPSTEHAILLQVLSTLPSVTPPAVCSRRDGASDGGGEGGDGGGGGPCAVYMAWLTAYVEILLGSRLANPPSSSPHLPPLRNRASEAAQRGGGLRVEAALEEEADDLVGQPDETRLTERCGARLAYRLIRAMLELERTALGVDGPVFASRYCAPSLVLLGAYLEHAYGQDDKFSSYSKSDKILEGGQVAGDGHGSDALIMSCERAAALCSCVMAAKPPFPAVLRPDRRGNLPLHILCDKDGVTEEEVGVLLREAPHTSACRDAGGRLPLALVCSNSCSFDACRTLEEAFPRALIYPDHAREKARGSSLSAASPALVHSLPIAALHAWARDARPRAVTWLEEHGPPLLDSRSGVACLGGGHSGRPVRPHRQEDARLGKGRPGWYQPGAS